MATLARRPREKLRLIKGYGYPRFLLLQSVNTLSFGPNYPYDEEGNIKPLFPLQKQLYIFFIQTAHRKGFRVFLVPLTWGPFTRGEPRNKTLFFDQATRMNLEWADIAEKYGVELYAPMNEPSIAVSDKEALNKWAHEVTPKIRERYSGILVYKAAPAEWGFDNDYRGYDYVGLDIYPGDEESLEGFRGRVRAHIEKGLEYAKRDGAKGVMFSEIGVQVVRCQNRSQRLKCRTA